MTTDPGKGGATAPPAAECAFVRYLVRPATIDGPAHAPGTEMEVRLLATVVDDYVVDDYGVRSPRLALRVKDWGMSLAPEPAPPSWRPRVVSRAHDNAVWVGHPGKREMLTPDEADAMAKSLVEHAAYVRELKKEQS